MRSAISTAIIGTRPRRLQLYPSLGKHFQTTSVHFDGNKMKMQTTYSSQVLFCTKSSGGLSKQQDYSNTNTAVSLLPPTPKMILRRILVSIVSSAALLLYSSLFISHCFAKTYDKCSVCEVVALQLFKEIKPPNDSKQPNLLTVREIIIIAERVCKKDLCFIEEENLEKKKLEPNMNTERLVCDLGCRETICKEDPTKKETICDKVMGKVNRSKFAKFINEQRWDGKFESLKTHLCENLTEACSTKKELVDLDEAVGISPELIDLLPTSKCKEKGLAKIKGLAKELFVFFSRKKSERCVVCRMKYKRGDRQITKWLSINKVCPVCRKEVFGNESN